MLKPSLVLLAAASVSAFAPALVNVRHSNAKAVSRSSCGIRMALAYGDETGQLSAESKGRLDDKTGIIRDYVVGPDTKWRFGKPDYTRVNKAYYDGRSKIHEADSLEAVVQKIVKNWEVESHHISDVNQWKTMEVKTFKAFTNGAGPVSAEVMRDVGPYNMLLGDIPSCPYMGSKETFESANEIFTKTFTEGFAWEVLEVFSGPPNVSFTWRHFGKLSGSFQGGPSTGEVINMVGHCLARVNDQMQITELQVHFDREDFMAQLTAGKKAQLGGIGGFFKQMLKL